eukprot:TRINITY_DN4690_c0_g1_i6.p1 TRINITY_DN4690_c0_g1~~TRINITY_DN4690_c0_g1_i6.p1  ORF type:complete len:246 (+),score=86.04 TRINITY_DN4690_c0_g1_i6:55-792(+)
MPPCSNMSIPRSTFVPEFPAKKPLKIEILQPLAAPKAQRHVGVVKSFNSNSGFGFIECKLSNDKYSRDVFLHKAQAGEIEVGTVVEFAIDINERGMPQARDVRRVEDDSREAKKARSELKEVATPKSASQTIQEQQNQLQQQQRELLQLQQQLLMANGMANGMATGVPQFPFQPALAAAATPQMIYQPVMMANTPTPMMYHVPVMGMMPQAFVASPLQMQQLQQQQQQLQQQQQQQQKDQDQESE